MLISYPGAMNTKLRGVGHGKIIIPPSTNRWSRRQEALEALYSFCPIKTKPSVTSQGLSQRRWTQLVAPLALSLIPRAAGRGSLDGNNSDLIAVACIVGVVVIFAGIYCCFQKDNHIEIAMDLPNANIINEDRNF